MSIVNANRKWRPPRRMTGPQASVVMRLEALSEKAPTTPWQAANVLIAAILIVVAGIGILSLWDLARHLLHVLAAIPALFAMAWTTPTQRSTGDLITASIYNTDLIDNLQYLLDRYETIFVPILQPPGAAANPYLTATYDPMRTSSLGGAQQANFLPFMMPSDFVQLIEAGISGIAGASATIQYDIYLEAAAVGEAYNTHTATLLNETTAVTVNDVYEIDVSALFTGVDASDWVGIQIISDGAGLYLMTLRITYQRS